MPKLTVTQLPNLAGQRALVRVDFNVPLDKDGTITNDRRIRAAVPTLNTLLDKGAALVVMSHLGRPKGDPVKDEPFRMNRVAARLGELLGRPVAKCDEVVGPRATAMAAALKPGDVLVLENVRFHPGEQAGDVGFAASLAALGDVYVNDAFGTCHRKDASMVAVPAAMTGKPRAVGLLVAKELDVIGKLLSQPDRPVVSVLGGAKVSDKIGFIKALLQRVDTVCVGGAMAYTFLKAQGLEIGNSLVEADKLDVARELLALGGGKILLPSDHVVATSPLAEARVSDAIPVGTAGFDIGPKTIARYTAEIAKAGTVVWNGPQGLFESPAFRAGTQAIAQALAQTNAVSIVGGGETAEAVEQLGLDARITHVSTGGRGVPGIRRGERHLLRWIKSTKPLALDDDRLRQ